MSTFGVRRVKANGTYLTIRQIAKFTNLLTSKITRHFQPRVGLGPSLAGTRLKAPGSLPDPDLSDEFEQDVALPILALAGIQQYPLRPYLYSVFEAELPRFEPRLNSGLGHQ